MPALSALLHSHLRASRICTGDSDLDRDLAQLHAGSDDETVEVTSGLPRKSLTEISGPPGVGKTCLALSLVLDSLRQGLSVLWLSCNYRPFPRMRLQTLAGGELPSTGSLHCKYLEDIAQLLLSQLDYDLIVIEHYDSLLVPLYARQYQRRARHIEVVLTRLTELSEQACVVATSTSIPQRMFLDDNTLSMLPAVKIPRKIPVKRMMLYRDEYGIVTASISGLKIIISEDGLHSYNREESVLGGSADSSSVTSSPRLSTSESTDTRLPLTPKNLPDLFGSGDLSSSPSITTVQTSALALSQSYGDGSAQSPANLSSLSGPRYKRMKLASHPPIPALQPQPDKTNRVEPSVGLAAEENGACLSACKASLPQPVKSVQYRQFGLDFGDIPNSQLEWTDRRYSVIPDEID